MEVLEPPLGLLMKAELMTINEQTFKLIQTLQQGNVSHENKQKALDTLKAIDQSLDMKAMECMKIKDRELKKSLMT